MIPGQGVRIPHASGSKKQNRNNRNNIVTNSIKTLEMTHIKEYILKKSFRANYSSTCEEKTVNEPY